MLQLKPEEYHCVIPLLKQVPFNTLLAEAVVNGKVSGLVFADRSTQPGACYIVHQYGMSFLIGDSTNDCFRNSILQYILNTEKQRGQEEWLQVYPDLWNCYLKEQLGSWLVEYTANPIEDIDYWNNIAAKHVLQWNRLNFNFNSCTFSALNPKLPAGFTVAKITAETGDIKGTVVPSKFFTNFQDFIDKGAGYGVFIGKQIVSAAFSSCLTDIQLEIGIETVAAHRGKGLAVHACKALIHYYLENGLEPIWSCRKENTSSLKLAWKLGFEISRCLPYYCIPLTFT